MAAENENCMWSFGYGSNMDVKALEAKKHVQTIDHTPAVLKNFKMSFNVFGIHHVEPAYAGLQEQEGSEVHGVAFCMTMDSVAELDRTESGYNKQKVTLYAYDGRELAGFVYMNKIPPRGEKAPSSRYLGVLLKGARQAGLKQEYIDRLAATPVYEADETTLKARKERPESKELKALTVTDLAQHKDDKPWISVLGYVVETVSWFGSHKGRDITTRVLMQYHGIPMDDNDDGGKPPYPLVKDFTAGELEYITRWLDHYQITKDDEARPIIGYLEEFKKQQDQGTTTFVLPEPPK